MTQDQKNYLTMADGTLIHFDNNPLLWKDETVITQLVNEIRDFKIQADSEAKKQIIDTTGHTSRKDLLLEEMSTLSYKAALKLSAFARMLKNQVLLNKVNYSPSSLSEGSESEVLSRCQVISDEYSSFLSQLQPYKGTQEELDLLKKSIEEYKTAPALRNAVGGDRKTATANIPNHIKSMRERFLVLDDLVEGTLDDARFVETYFNLRDINKRKGGRISSLKPAQV